MNLWILFRLQRRTGVAVLFTVAMHALVLVGMSQCSMFQQADFHPDPQRLRPPMQMLLLAEPMLASKALVIKAEPESAAPSPVNRPQQQVVAQTSATTKLPASGREVQAETRPIEDAAHHERMGGNASDSPTTTSKQMAGAVAQSRGEGRATESNATPAEKRPEQRPSQDARPDYAYNPQPDYPMLLREQGVGGVVWLRVWVDSDGRPVEIKLAKGSGYRLLDDAALRAVKLWRFTPASNGEERLASWVEFPIRFALSS